MCPVTGVLWPLQWIWIGIEIYIITKKNVSWFLFNWIFFFFAEKQRTNERHNHKLQAEKW